MAARILDHADLDLGGTFPSMSLKRKTRANLAWAAIHTVFNQCLGFVIQILLARLLPPSEFGLLAAVSIFVFICQIIVDGGLGDALVQSRELTRKDLSSVFFLNLGLALFLILGLFVVAPGIARFYAKPELVALLRTLSLTLLFFAGCVTQLRMFARELQFRRLFLVSLVAQVAGGIVAVGLAWNGYRAWSLVGQSLVV
ncbi:MAG TPA: oligosaccharide flippase family protein, partial [Pirellulaceae bacterium]